MPSATGNPDSLVISYLTLRRMLGLLGFVLPFVLYFGGRILFGEALQSSISDYYHTDMRDVFVGSIIAIGIFLFSYTGYSEAGHVTDNTVTNLAGGSAIGLALFRTTPGIAGGALDPGGAIHLVFSALFFLSLAYMSAFHFTKSDPKTPPTPQKLIRNRVYRVCAAVMVIAVIVIGAMKWLLPGETQAVWEAYEPVFWLEAAAVVAFGASWLIKGETLLRDETGGAETAQAPKSPPVPQR